MAVSRSIAALLCVSASHAILLQSTRDPEPLAAQQFNETEVADFHQKMEKLGDKIKTLFSDGGPLANSPKMADHMKSWYSEFQSRLQSTRGLPLQKQMEILKEAQHSVQTLSADINSQQQRLVEEGKADTQSLLLGVLMQRKDEPFQKQLEVLSDGSFRSLPVVDILQNLKTKGDFTTPLVEQVAAYFDTHDTKPAAREEAPAPTQPPLLVEKNGQSGGVASIVAGLEANLETLRRVSSSMKAKQAASLEVLEAAAKRHAGEQPEVAKKFKHIAKMEAKKFAEDLAVADARADAVEKALKAVKAGDVEAAKKVEQELKELAEDPHEKNKHLVLIDLEHHATSSDCPYCVAQCVEKCHGAGKPYLGCLKECAHAEPPVQL
eukprot:TRINITY_DN38555_c0_g1_i1.p1 TRINITY_DN38555_c0_g1~~TRINITY_DN38555_c0_g1_i1.p1  ORF type:complete len:402 (+),score=115.14 TRINITY_DN38555_c0_g1_i1:71-1207(+)